MNLQYSCISRPYREGVVRNWLINWCLCQSCCYWGRKLCSCLWNFLVNKWRLGWSVGQYFDVLKHDSWSLKEEKHRLANEDSETMTYSPDSPVILFSPLCYCPVEQPLQENWSVTLFACILSCVPLCLRTGSPDLLTCWASITCLVPCHLSGVLPFLPASSLSAHLHPLISLSSVKHDILPQLPGLYINFFTFLSTCLLNELVSCHENSWTNYSD